MTSMRCKCRKQAETGLRCVRCNVPICPDCSRNAPVGFLCRNCASGRSSTRLYQIDARGMALGYLGSLAAGLFGGWIVTSYGLYIGFFGWGLAFVIGNLVAEAGLRITGRKRGLQMEIMAGLSTFLGFFGGLLIHLSTHPVIEEGVKEATNLTLQYELMNPLIYVVLGCALAGAILRVRNI